MIAPSCACPSIGSPTSFDAADDGRDRILVALGIYTLMRWGELLVLRVGDVDLGAGSLAMVVPKSHLRDELDVELRRWFEITPSGSGARCARRTSSCRGA